MDTTPTKALRILTGKACGFALIGLGATDSAALVARLTEFLEGQYEVREVAREGASVRFVYGSRTEGGRFRVMGRLDTVIEAEA